MAPGTSQDTSSLCEALCLQHPGYITDQLPECPYHRHSTRVGLDSLPQSSSPLSDSLFYSFTYSTDPLQSPHCVHMRAGTKFGDVSLTDTMMKDGLLDAFHNYHMGITAENVARQHSIARQQQDEFAAASQNKTEAAQKAGLFAKEIIPVTIQSRKGE